MSSNLRGATLAQDVRRAHTDSFVLRLWRESTGGESPTWRWKAHHVQGREERYLSNLADLLSFVGRCADTVPPELSSQGDRAAVGP